MPRQALAAVIRTRAVSWRPACTSRQLTWQYVNFRRTNRRYLSSRTTHYEDGNQDRETLKAFQRALTFPVPTSSLRNLLLYGVQQIGQPVCLHGYIGARRDANSKLTFAQLSNPELDLTIQVVSNLGGDADEAQQQRHLLLQSLIEHTPVAIRGTIAARKAVKAKLSIEPTLQKQCHLAHILEIEVKIDDIAVLNPFPRDIIMKADTVMLPEQRHLQIRNDAALRQALLFRGRVARFMRVHLAREYAFEEIETPLLFKSTPEGAREFLVPTRQPGMAYALPQSPQQYKQILMASGIPRYMQLARCFRDEDLRADRQPEFTQVDLEMAFACGEDVMQVVEATIKALWRSELKVDDLPKQFLRLTYQDAMSTYGSDKPDMRFGSEIHRVDYMLPVDLVSKIGPLTRPIVETMKIRISDSPERTRAFVNTFMTSVDARPFVQNPDGQPGIFVVDSKRPLLGLQPFGFEAAEQLEEMLDLQDGDLVVLQARQDLPFAGGSTPLGNLRLALHKAAVEQDLIDRPSGFAFLWVTDFPLFSPANDIDPGQEGSKGLAATHHPFTAPKTAEDVELLLDQPLLAKADHYDLVVNGIELGGGSRRIHHAPMQELVLRKVLGMSNDRVKDFAHLLEVLRAGCPPHAGIALGFDRMIAVMLGKTSVRDVIAFPKSGRGEDLLVGSPSKMTDSQFHTYHLRPETSIA